MREKGIGCSRRSVPVKRSTRLRRVPMSCTVRQGGHRFAGQGDLEGSERPPHTSHPPPGRRDRTPPTLSRTTRRPLKPGRGSRSTNLTPHGGGTEIEALGVLTFLCGIALSTASPVLAPVIDRWSVLTGPPQRSWKTARRRWNSSDPVGREHYLISAVADVDHGPPTDGPPSHIRSRSDRRGGDGERLIARMYTKHPEGVGVIPGARVLGP